MHLLSLVAPKEATALIGLAEAALHLWLARQCHFVSSNLSWEQDEHALRIQAVAAALQLATGWCVAGALAGLAVVFLGVPKSHLTSLRLFALFETFDLSLSALLTGATILSASIRSWRTALTSLLCTQAQQTDNSWMSTIPLEECGDALAGQWSAVTLVFLLGLCLKAHATLVVRSYFQMTVRRLAGVITSARSEHQPGVIMLHSEEDTDSQQTLLPLSDNPVKLA